MGRTAAPGCDLCLLEISNESRPVEHKTTNVAEKMARLVSLVERSRARSGPHPRLTRGEELEAVLELSESFPARPRGPLSYP